VSHRLECASGLDIHLDCEKTEYCHTGRDKLQCKRHSPDIGSMMNVQSDAIFTRSALIAKGHAPEKRTIDKICNHHSDGHHDLE
jgi:hypothetical protein